jgi:hypothetical protein
MTTRKKALMLGAAVLCAALTMYVRAGAQAVTPRPAELRFQAVLNEPIATPNQRSVVAGTSALLVKDRVTGRCFLAVTVGNSVGLSPAECGQ